MNKRITVFLTVGVLFLLLFSHTPIPFCPPVTTIIGMDISWNQNSGILHRTIQKPEKMEPILNTLRSFQQDGISCRLPLPPFGDEVLFTLLFSDGTCKTYTLVSCRYMHTDAGQWKPIKEEQAKNLLLMIGSMESD